MGRSTSPYSWMAVAAFLLEAVGGMLFPFVDEQAAQTRWLVIEALTGAFVGYWLYRLRRRYAR